VTLTQTGYDSTCNNQCVILTMTCISDLLKLSVFSLLHIQQVYVSMLANPILGNAELTETVIYLQC
jgi:hypothetical protein